MADETQAADAVTPEPEPTEDTETVAPPDAQPDSPASCPICKRFLHFGTCTFCGYQEQ